MTHTTPEQARELASGSYLPEHIEYALRSLATQLEVMTAERDAYKLDAQSIQSAKPQVTEEDVDRACSLFHSRFSGKKSVGENMRRALEDFVAYRAAIAKEAK